MRCAPDSALAYDRCCPRRFSPWHDSSLLRGELRPSAAAEERGLRGIGARCGGPGLKRPTGLADILRLER